MPALLAVLVAALTFATLNVANAESLNACASKKKGSLRLVVSPTDCDAKRKTAVSWNTVGPQGPRLVDANGQNLGTLLGRGEVFNDHLNLIILIDILADEYSEPEVFAGCCGEVFWNLDDCTGQPYASVAHSGLLISDWADSPRFYAPTTGPPATTIESLSEEGNCIDFEGLVAEPGSLVPVAEVTGSLGFEWPLALPLRVEPRRLGRSSGSTSP